MKNEGDGREEVQLKVRRREGGSWDIYGLRRDAYLKFTSSNPPLFSDNGERAAGLVTSPARRSPLARIESRPGTAVGNYVCIIFNLATEAHGISTRIRAASMYHRISHRCAPIIANNSPIAPSQNR